MDNVVRVVVQYYLKSPVRNIDLLYEGVIPTVAGNGVLETNAPKVAPFEEFSNSLGSTVREGSTGQDSITPHDAAGDTVGAKV